MVAEVMLLTRDAGFVRKGQEVAVKLEAFPFTDHGLIPGTLTRIIRDAVEQENVGLVYTARVALDCAPTGEDTRKAAQTAALCRAMSAGMTATAEIKTDQLRIIDYFFSPISKATSEAGRER
ncbi:HlyD family efflux transporter periplasmic adaptor subunit [Pacificimonas pallii]|uniref:HlyD family efflux transporter periplasmic adaptor subunit n=1 Tax=Pacificimonas pallii TaxID=2827236 RepID=UPI002105D893|nr:HlyD family efflux transporter periplasmic adaptor subunit [Pacificimonas pallii]